MKGGLPAWVATLISLTNLTSAGQFAGTNLILAGASLLEITLTTLIINLRYLLMSLSLGQKLSPGMTLRQRCLIAFGITDETFTVASLERTAISFPYMVGLIVGPYTGWGTGTLLGGIVCTLLPDNLQNALGITLYAMFIALVLPRQEIPRRPLGCCRGGRAQFRPHLATRVTTALGRMADHDCHPHCLSLRSVFFPQEGG